MKETSRDEISFKVSIDDRKLNSTSSKGNQQKWKNSEGIWLKSDYMGYEGLVEAVCSRILANSNFKEFAIYSTCRISEKLNREGVPKEYTGCYSVDFLKANTSLVTLHRLFESLGMSIAKKFDRLSTEDRIKYIVEVVTCETGIKEFGKWLGMLLEFDAFSLNEDRHLNNIAIVKGKDNYSLMPVFDNGAGFLSDITRDYPLYESIRRLINSVRSKPFSTSFDKQAEVARSLYGSNLKLKDIDLTFTEIEKQLYSDEVRDRVETIYRIQRNKYLYLFTDD